MELLLFVLLAPVAAMELNLSLTESIKSVASTIAYDLMSIYNGNYTGGIPGMLPYPPYHWWESGGMWVTMMDYWAYTNDSTYNDNIKQGLLFQVGPNWDYLPPNQTIGMGNDDQGFWGMSAMTAAELGFSDPPPDQPQWLGLAQAVFNEYVIRWQQETVCGGGLRWQVHFWDEEWTYKNAISNGCMFNIGARLARYTKNESYTMWAETAWNWMSGNWTEHGGNGAGGYVIWDGVTVPSNCTGVNGVPYSYNAGVMMHGAATMYNLTGSDVWANRTSMLLNATLNVFFRDGIMVEVACEKQNSCNTDMISFKAYLTRSMTNTAHLALFTRERIMPALATSAQAAVSQCKFGSNGRMCSIDWSKGNGSFGAGEEMSTMEIVLANLGTTNSVTADNGGTSVGNPAAGMKVEPPVIVQLPPWRGDVVGASFLTVFVIWCMFVLFGMMCLDEEWPVRVDADGQQASNIGSKSVDGGASSESSGSLKD